MSDLVYDKGVTDDMGFTYTVSMEHVPHHGYSLALYKGVIINSVDRGKLYQPLGDNDAEWERYDETLDQWKADAEDDLILGCKTYFNNIN